MKKITGKNIDLTDKIPEMLRVGGLFYHIKFTLLLKMHYLEQIDDWLFKS